MKKRHHHVPRFYLAGFVDPADGSTLWQYDKVSGLVTASSPSNAGLRRHYHSIPQRDGTRDTSAEDSLAKIEDQAAPVFRRFVEGTVLDNRERSIVSNFLALMLLRAPAFRDAVEQFNAAVIKNATQLMAARGRFDSMPIPAGSEPEIARLKKLFAKGDFEVEIRPHASLPVLTIAPRIAEIVHRMTWIVVRSRARLFITSDNPVVYSGPAAGPKSRGQVEVTIPLSATVGLFAGWDGDGGIHHMRTRDSMVRTINHHTAAGAQRFAYAPENSESLKKLVMKYRDSGPRIKISS
jgi:Protein of unknown function (DUF4238)